MSGSKVGLDENFIISKIRQSIQTLNASQQKNGLVTLSDKGQAASSVSPGSHPKVETAVHGSEEQEEAPQVPVTRIQPDTGAPIQKDT